MIKIKTVYTDLYFIMIDNVFFKGIILLKVFPNPNNINPFNIVSIQPNIIQTIIQGKNIKKLTYTV